MLLTLVRHLFTQNFHGRGRAHGKIQISRRNPMPEVMTKVVFSRGLTDGSHVRRFNVERAPAEGWHVREERDAEVKQVTYADWHRVELAIRGFSAEASQLTQKGWRIFH